MFAVRALLTILIVLVSFGSQGYALTGSLDELISQKGIIMPDLEARYPDAEAVIILDEKEIEQSRIINPVYIYRHVVVKIMKQSAVEKFRTVKVPYYQEVKISDFEARTINDGSIIKVRDFPERKPDLEGLDKGFIFPLEQGTTLFALRKEELNTNPGAGDLLKMNPNPVFYKKREDVWRIRQIDFPEVRVGSVIEYSYKIEQKRVVLYDRFLFQRQYPILKASYTMRNAKMLRFNYETNYFTSRPHRVFEPRFTNLESQNNIKVRTAMRTIDVSSNPDTWQLYGHYFLELKMDTVDAYPAGLPFAPPYPDICPRIDVFLREAVNLRQKGQNDFRVRTEGFASNWNFPIYRLSQKSLFDERQSRRAKEAVGEVIIGAEKPEDKVTAAVGWARGKYKDNRDIRNWDSFFWCWEARNPGRMLNETETNAADVAAFLVAALSWSDLAVYPGYGKTRARGKLLQRVCCETQFDTPLLALELASKRYKFWQPVNDIAMPADYIDYSLEGTTVMINTSLEGDVSFELKELPFLDADKSRSSLNASLSLGEDGTASGKLSLSSTGHLNAAVRRRLIDGQGGDKWLELISGPSAGVSIDGSPEMDDPAAYTEKYNIAAGISIDRACRTVEGGLALKACLLTDPFSSPLTGEGRRFEVEFPHKAQFSYDIEIAVPGGYSLPDTLPKPVQLKSRAVTYSRIIAKTGEGTLLIKREFTVKQPVLQVRSYNRRYSKIFDKIQKADATEIVLPKL